MKPIAAHIGWSRGSSFVSKMIRRLDGGYFNHVYWRFDFETGSLIYESHLNGGVQITPYEHLMSAKLKGVVEDVYESKLILTPAQCKLLWNDCIPMHGKGYDTAQILRYYAWIRFWQRADHKVVNLYDNKKYTCNEFIVSNNYGLTVLSELHDADLSHTPEKLFQDFHKGITSKSFMEGTL